MRAGSHHFKSTVAALIVAVGFSLPAAADTLDELFAELGQAEPGAEGRIVARIYDEWGKSGSPSVDLLLRRGEEALEAGDAGLAADHFTAAIDHAPDFAEAWHGRARAYYDLGLFGPALDDLRQTLVLNPRHFGAMQGFAVMLEEMGRKQDALELMRRVHDLNPADQMVIDTIARLAEELEGIDA